ncbi:MAG: M28 family peptidase [Solirubrobacterales bacterium]|nr:M28 family peptidase [Solirubrobacterales bacterium]
MRLAFWGAEEAGLIGSTQYIAQLTEAERNEILLNLNFDMLASPNFVRFVYDGNTDDTPPPEGGAPPGSDVIEQVFLDYFASRGLPTAPTAFDGRSDYGPFIAQGIPAGGLFSGAEGIKTPAQAAVYGGVAGEQYDPCYHEVCDTFDSVFGSGSGVPGLDANGATSLDQMSDAVAHATLHFVTEPNPLATATPVTTSSARSKGLAPYKLDFRGPERAAR